jgi:hypothetical protein
VRRVVTQHKIIDSMHNRCTTQERQAAVVTSAHDRTSAASRYEQQQWEADTSKNSGQAAARKLHANTAMLEAEQLRLFSRGSHHPHSDARQHLASSA